MIARRGMRIRPIGVIRTPYRRASGAGWLGRGEVRARGGIVADERFTRKGGGKT